MRSGRADAATGEEAATAGEPSTVLAVAGLPGANPGAAGGHLSANGKPAPQQRQQQQLLPLAQRSSRDPRLQAGRAVAAGAATASPGSAVPAATAATAQPSPAIAAAGGSASAAAGSWLGMSDKQPAEPQQGEAARDSQQEEGTEGDPQQQRQCSHCGSTATGGNRWYRHPTIRALLCNACWKYARRKAGQLPARRLLERRERDRHVLPPAQRRCLHCESTRPGPSSYAPGHWRGVAVPALLHKSLQAAQAPAAAGGSTWRPLWEQQRQRGGRAGAGSRQALASTSAAASGRRCLRGRRQHPCWGASCHRQAAHSGKTALL